MQVPRVRNAISGGFTVFVLRGEAAEEKALALDGTDMEDGSYLLQFYRQNSASLVLV